MKWGRPRLKIKATWEYFPTVNGVPIELRPLAARLLERLLMSAPGEWIATADIIEWLWPNPDVQPLFADKIISQGVGSLRRNGIFVETSFARGSGCPIKAYRIPAEYRREGEERMAA